MDPPGQVVAEAELPTRCVTCPMLCGTELFVTSMGEVDPQKYPDSLKYQGAVFKVDVGVRGKPLNVACFLSGETEKLLVDRRPP